MTDRETKTANQQRVALVTGGIGGIGTAICQKLAQKGIRVAVGFRDQTKADLWLATQRALGFDFFMFQADVSDFTACEKMVSQIQDTVGVIDILVNNAGITRDTQLKNMSYEQWQTVLRTNLDSVFNVTRAVINSMIHQNYGRVINISSINGQKGQFGQTNYSAAKAGIHGFTMALAQEVAKKNITVNTISPGYIATDMVMSMPEAIREKIITQIPVGRLGKPEEIARLVAFLASDQSGFITGADIAINGGQYMA